MSLKQMQYSLRGLSRIMAIFLAITLASPALHADDDARVVTQKLKLLTTMLDQSKQVRQIDDSDDEDAKGLLVQARELTAIARQALEEGDDHGAGAAINGALKALESARSAFNAGGRSTLVERARFSELQNSIRSFRASLGPEAASRVDQQQVDSLIAEAQTMIKNDDYVAANAKLNNAYQLIVSAVNDGYTQNTLVYSLNFETPKQEYQYELRRFKGNALLIDKLLSQKEDSQTKQLVVRYLEQAGKTREQAHALADGGNYQQAIASMEKASSQLKRAMGMLGINF